MKNPAYTPFNSVCNWSKTMMTVALAWFALGIIVGVIPLALYIAWKDE